MKKIKIFSDSACDLSLEQAKKMNVDIISYYVRFDSSREYKELRELSVENFYTLLKDKEKRPKTSLPSTQDYIDAFTPYLNNDMDIICICLSSKFSGSYQAASLARDVLKDEYPHLRICVIDSQFVSGLQALLINEIVQMNENGCSFDTIVRTANQLIGGGDLIFTIDQLEFLKRGGRIGKASAFAGGLLNIKPIICLTEGELHPHAKMRGRQKAIQYLMDYVEKYRHNREEYASCIIHSDCLNEAKLLQTQLYGEDNLKESLPIVTIGATIGTHTGPSALGICILKKINPM